MKSKLTTSQLRFKYFKKNGFALISAIMIMALLMLVALAMLSLSSTSTRTVAYSSGIAEAKANARMALLFAIGELQKQMGPDQRISANADIFSLDPAGKKVSVANPHWTGVWDSWKAGAGENSQHSTIGDADEMAPSYETNRSDHFRGWLLSLNPDDIKPDKALNTSLPINLSLDGKLAPTLTDTDIRLVGDGSLSNAASTFDYVSARLLKVAKPTDPSIITGRYGWWIGDQSQKARLMPDSYQNATLTAADKIFRSQAPASMGSKSTLGLETMKDEQELGKLPSLKSLDLIDLATPPTTGSPKVSQLNFHNTSIYGQGVLADVREGGLKRDLSIILEQPIRREDNGDEFMLYEFDDPRFPHQDNPLDDRRANSRVPIQDLAAYYQLYDNEPSLANNRREGVKYDSSQLNDAIQLRVADLDGGNRNKQRFLRDYTSQYKQPVVTKIQFLLSISSQPITTADREWVKTQTYLRSRQPMPHIRDEDTHKLKLGVTPLITFWNPNNLPLVMDNSQRFYLTTPPFALQFRKHRGSGETVDLRWFNLSGASYHGGSSGNAGGYPLLGLRFGAQPIVFEPGEVKAFSVPSTSGANLNDPNAGLVNFSQGSVLNTVNEWDPYGIFLLYSSTPSGSYKDQAPDAYHFTHSRREECMVFGPNDRISLQIDTDSPQETANNNWRDGRSVSRAASITGTGFHHYMIDEDYATPWRNFEDAWRHNVMISRHGGRGNNALASEVAAFNRELLLPGFPGGTAPIDFETETNALPGSQIIAAGNTDEVISLMEFSLNIGCETSNIASGGFGGGRRISSRPFLHSAPSTPPFIDQSGKASLYNYGLDWTISKVNTLEDSIVTAQPGTGNGYFGGGYTLENGATHVIQREIPVLPPISIASLSHAELGGFSLAYSKSMGDDPDTDVFWSKTRDGDRPMGNPIGVDYQRVTATGQGGLTPHVMQATGNSYAHPNIPADKAFTTVTRHFDADEGPVAGIPFVDHSYLANKALWDEFFFSSIAPQPSKVPLFDSSDRTAKQVADDFFFNEKLLPNRRIISNKNSITQTDLDVLFTEKDRYTNGLADKIAAHLMVDGVFNVNSTSVGAWKVFLSSLKGKPAAYLDGGDTPKEAVSEGTTISQGTLPNATPVKTADITSPNLPAEQWKAGRELTDQDIDQLAAAIVKQVKQRGPFLSLSEFVNRRLDDNNLPFSLKGALQAALDDEDVAINANFRQPERMLDAETAAITGFKFPDAAKGPVAYGSAPYVDQADVLQHFSEQLTPRGDTFVIRTYGDSIDSSGKIVARAWCEAVVQRIPDYVDPSSSTGDDAYIKQADLISEANKTFGRQFKMISFRWLNPDEV